MTDGKLRFYTNGKETFTIEDPYWGKCQTPKTQLYIKEMTHEEMLQIAEQREEENIILAKISDEDLKKVQDALEVAKKGIEQYKPALDELADTERPFYRFFAVEYFGNGEGMSYWLKACRNYQSFDDKDREMERFKEFIGCEFYYGGIEEPTEEEFRTRYAKLIPEYVSKMLDKRDQPGFIWKTHYHFNYS